MTFEELLAAFADEFGIEGLSSQDGVSALDIDGMVVIMMDVGDALIANASIGQQPPENAEIFAHLLLEANQELWNGTTTFARNHESGEYILIARFPFVSLEFDAFCDELSSFVNKVEQWHRLLEDFRPSAEKAQKITEDEGNATFPIGNGFMQV